MKINDRSQAANFIALIVMLLSVAGCGMSALSSGSTAPAIAASGWTNGAAPTDLDGNIVVLEMFATW